LSGADEKAAIEVEGISDLDWNRVRRAVIYFLEPKSTGKTRCKLYDRKSKAGIHAG
jgi:hypothetical protein